MKKKLLTILLLVGMGFGLAACDSEADRASQNVSTAADNFEVNRRVVFYNGITGEYILSIEGRCSLGNNDTSRHMSVTCKTGASEYRRHFLGLSDNVTFFAEQVESVRAHPFHYRVIFRPANIIPSIEVQ